MFAVLALRAYFRSDIRVGIDKQDGSFLSFFISEGEAELSLKSLHVRVVSEETVVSLFVVMNLCYRSRNG